MKQIIITCALLTLTACVYPNMPTPEAQITPTYVSSAKYQNFTCIQLQAEFDSVSRREAQVQKAQEQRYKTSQQQALWWGYGQGDGIEASELANLRGEKEAIRKSADEKGCKI